MATVRATQDIVQETLLRAWRNPKVLDQAQGSARAWLFTVARHLVIDEWRTAAHSWRWRRLSPPRAGRPAMRRTACCSPG
ncbi:MAG: sigma factor [Dermatophilaceae bacterium]